MNAIDTNVWLYAYDTRDPAKQSRSQELLASLQPLVLLWQVGCEFVAAARKLEPLGFTPEQAWDALDKMQAAVDSVVLPDSTVWVVARELQTRFTLHFWDALIVAGCVRGGVTTLYSEDLGHGTEIDGVTVINPFLPP